MRSLCWMLVMVLFSGCAGLIDPKEAGNNPAFSFLNSYKSALNDFEKGRIMLARERVLAMDKSRDDYPAALKLLKTKIDPARLRLLGHYTTKARLAERAGLWSRAMIFYAQAAGLNTTPKALKDKRDEMELNMRQLRMEKLLDQRRKEDSTLLAWLNAYEPPKGIDSRDDAFARAREHARDYLEDRAILAYREAKYFLNKDLPEIAYIEAESYVRLAPDSHRGAKLLADIKEEMPRGIRVSSNKRDAPRSSLSVRSAVPETVKREQVQDLIRQGDWVKAKKFALVYRREGGKGADLLLKKIQANMEKEAATYFARGRVAFRQEQLQAAIDYWEKSVTLMPENDEYASALQRARQLQDQLRVLRETASEKAQ